MSLDIVDKSKPLVAVALSGGVDSAVAALLLKKQGYRLLGVHMINWDRQLNELTEDRCSYQQEDVISAREIANLLDIPLYIYNFTAEYWRYVFKPFLDSIRSNLIGNPDLACNSKIKFGVLLDSVKRNFGPEIKLATGHYAKITQEGEKFYLDVCKSLSKDQTYFLSMLTPAQLKEIIFPLSEFESKEEVRKIARENGLPNWDRKGSCGICFIGKRNFSAFIAKYLNKEVKGLVGEVVDREKKCKLGEHKGLCLYSLNQRKGLNLSGRKERYYVCGKEPTSSVLYVCPESQRTRYLTSNSCVVEKLHWINEAPGEGEQLSLKFKHTSSFFVGNIITIEGEELELKHETAFVSTPGQYVVFYTSDKSRCLGAGVYREPILS